MVPQFVDVSSFQGQLDFTAYSAWARQWDGKARMAVKATEGMGFVDPLFRDNRDRALAAGIDEICFYHFARPDLGNDPVAEAKFMHSVVGDIRDGDQIFLDYEVSSPLATSSWAYMWLFQMEDSYDGKLPGIYASSAYIQQHLQDTLLARYPLWLANWQFTPDERPPCPPPWQTYEFVQYTDRASIPGISGIVDCNIFLGGTTPMPTPTPPSGHQIQAANDSWDSVLKNMVAGPAPTGSGIYEQWLGALIAGKFYGPPLTHEYPSVDWAGNPIVVQEFAHARCEWKPNGGLLGWYDENGKLP